jgi:hypothetical protein
MGFVLAVSGVTLARQSSEPYEEIVVQGRLLCLDSKNQTVSINSQCDLTKNILGFVDEKKGRFTFSSHDTTQAMLNDPRVRTQELRLTARRRAQNQLETIRVQALKAGKLYDLYYFCDVCNITSYAPGPCPCCYQDLEFIEKPAIDH